MKCCFGTAYLCFSVPRRAPSVIVGVKTALGWMLETAWFQLNIKCRYIGTSRLSQRGLAVCPESVEAGISHVTTAAMLRLPSGRVGNLEQSHFLRSVTADYLIHPTQKLHSQQNSNCGYLKTKTNKKSHPKEEPGHNFNPTWAVIRWYSCER